MADVGTLIENLKTGDYYSRVSAARALGEIGGEKAAAALIEALDDADDWVKEYAAEALGKLAYAPAVDHIGELLNSDNYKVRSSAVVALGNIGGDRALDLLEPLKNDADSWVREAAVNVLERFPKEVVETQSSAAPVVPGPIPAEIEAESALALTEEPLGADEAVGPLKFSLADQTPRTPEEIVGLITEGTSIKYKATRSGFLLNVNVGGGRYQRVRLKFDSVDEDGSPIILVITIIGPARPEHYEWALKLNPGFSYGAIGLVRIDGKELLAIVDTFLEENVAPKALQKSVMTLARRGDALERKLIRKDLW